MIIEPWQKFWGPFPPPLSLHLTVCLCTLSVEGGSSIFSPTLSSLMLDFFLKHFLFVCLWAIIVKTCTAYFVTLLG